MRLIQSTVRFAVLCAGFVLVVACGGGPTNTYTITGSYLTEDTPSESAQQQPFDLSAARITLSMLTETDGGEVVSVEIESQKFRDGKVEFSGRIDEPSVIEIAVKFNGENEEISTRAMLTPGDELEFGLINLGQVFRPYRLTMVGTSYLVEDEAKKYSISGDLSQLTKNSQFALLEVGTWQFQSNNTRPFRSIASVLLDKGQFLIEHQIDEPTAVEIFVDTSSGSYAYTPAIIEPSSNITISTSGSSAHALATMPVGWFDLEQQENSAERQASANILLATAGSGRHARLVESWQRSFEYLAKLNELDVAEQEWNKQRERTSNLRQQNNTPPLANDGSTDRQSDRNISSWSAPDLEIAPEAGCEHVDLLSVRPFGTYLLDNATRATNETPPHIQIRNDLWSLRLDTLTGIAFNSVDPFDSLLAIELGIERINSGLAHHKRVLTLLENLGTLLDDEDLVERRVEPRRALLANTVEIEELDAKRVPGQRAPEFTLPSLNGDSVSLSDLVQENDTLLIYFWTPVAGIRYIQYRFNALQEIRGKYKNNGFEIVTIGHSGDFPDLDTESWQVASEEYGITWPNLGEFAGEQNRSVVRTYGAEGRKNYLLDSQGCIIQKDLSLHGLGEVLLERYGTGSSSD